MNKFLTIKEVRGLLGVSRQTVIRWILNGKLPAFKLGGGRLWRIRERNLKIFLASKHER
jgi:excisionase family DNA binding protein